MTAASAPTRAPAATDRATGADGVRLPQQGWHRTGQRPGRVLLVCFYDPAGISTVPETVAFLQSASRFAVTVLNLFEHRADTGFLRLHAWLNLDAFDAVVIHNTVSYDVDNLRSLDAGLRRKLRDYRGAKVLMKQDENHRFLELARYVGDTGFDLVFTCLPPQAVPLVYPPRLAGSPRFERMLTGYVTPTLRALRAGAGARPVDIGYRGSIQPLSFGRLAYEKRTIGEDVERLLAGRGLVLDISSRAQDRLGGEAWFAFLRSCKATLGAESGASIFDLEGDLEARMAQLERRHAALPAGRERDEAILAGLADLEGRVDYAQVSPRHFEAAACATLQLLYPGRYSGLLQPGRHFFPLARDHSNLDEAVALLRDAARREEMTARAYEEVVMDRSNWIETFVERVDACIAGVLDAKGGAHAPLLADHRAAHHVLVLAAGDPADDARAAALAASAPASLRVHRLGLADAPADPARRQATPEGAPLLFAPPANCPPELPLRLAGELAHSAAGTAAAHELLFVQQALALPEHAFCSVFGAPAEAARNAEFRRALRELLATSAALLAQARRLRGVHAVAAAEVRTLLPALLLKGLFGVPVICDVTAGRAGAQAGACEYEAQFWDALAQRLAVHADVPCRGVPQPDGPEWAQLLQRLPKAPEPLLVYPECEDVAPLQPVRSVAAAATRGLQRLLEAALPPEPPQAGRAGAAGPAGPAAPAAPGYRRAVGVWRRLPFGLRRVLEPLARRLRARLRG